MIDIFYGAGEMGLSAAFLYAVFKGTGEQVALLTLLSTRGIHREFTPTVY